MEARNVTKASLLVTGALLGAIAVSVSVAEHQQTASRSSAKPSQTITAQVTHMPIFLAPLRTEHAAAVTVPKVPTAPTFLPIVNQADMQMNQKELADTVLRRLPSLCRNNLKNLYVLYSNAKNRGLGGKSTIFIDGTVPNNEFVGLMVHECGHVIHANLLGNSSSGKSRFTDGGDVFAADSPAAAFFAISWTNVKTRNKGSISQDFVSGYAKTDPFEDFAETFATYVLERPSFEARAAKNPIVMQKLQWMNQYLPLPNNTLGIPLYSWDGSIPWDATKLSFVWKPITLNTVQ